MFNTEGTKWFLMVAGELKAKRMLELGDQLIWEHSRRPLGIPFNVAKEWFTSMGVEHVSVDLNGAHGALQLDLGKPIDRPEWRNYFDLVTNVGTLEHIEPLAAQYFALKNMHDFCAVGGLMIHQLPPKGQWLDHCHMRYDEIFAQRLAVLNNYEIVAMERTNLAALGGHVDYLDVAFRKRTGRPFTDQRQRLLETIEWT